MSTYPGETERRSATEPLQPDKSLGELFGEMTTDVSTLLRKEVELAKVELREEGRRAGRAGGMFAVAAIGGLLALTFVSAAIAWLLDKAMDRGLAFGLVGVVWAIVAAVLAQRARHELDDLEVVPQTKETLQEDMQWVRQQKN